MWQRLARAWCVRALVAGSMGLVAVPAAQARGPWRMLEPDTAPAEATTLDAVALADLPPEGRAMYARILQGGPFRQEKDGVVFGNRERLLPAQPRGYYREYTVRTPGSRDRGARRIVCGGAVPAVPDRCYYSDDHYASFRPIAP